MNQSEIKRIYEYLSAEVKPFGCADGAFVFGRADWRVADKATQVFGDNLVKYCLISGGIGKDSGALAKMKIPEAHYIASLMIGRRGIDVDKIYVEPRPTNGGECWEMGIETLLANNLPHESLKVIVHPTSLRRIMAMFGTISQRVGFNAELQGIGTAYSFNAENPIDQREAVAELLRLADWPAKGWCTKQKDLPHDLVQIAREYNSLLSAKK